MFIKSLRIETPTEVIRDINFKAGLNIIVDDTPITGDKITGNNVGKTTVLKLIDFCLGAKTNIIYTDPENRKATYDLVKNYLIDNEILITLILISSFCDKDNKNEIVIKRNFLPQKRSVRQINGKNILEKDFDKELSKLLLPNLKDDKPTARQFISHNIRYRDESINNTLKTLDRFTTDAEYETLYLFLFGCIFDDGAKKQALLVKLKQEENFKNRLEKNQTKTAYKIALSILNDEIISLNNKKSMLNLNENFDKDLDELNNIKYSINKISSSISKKKLRKELIEEATNDLEDNISNIDLKQLRELYSEVTTNINNIQKTFDQLVEYHNNMIIEKARFISSELPQLVENINNEEKKLSFLLNKEKEFSQKIAKSDSFEELENIIAELNQKYRTKGEYENIISQLDEVEDNINNLNNQINQIDKILFSQNFEDILRQQITKFNKYFSSISQELYGEKYALKYDKSINKQQQIYKFSSFNANLSSGKKQGEILCFDLAYILFADEEKIPCLHFLLNDKKELMHDNQLIKVAEFIENKNIQLVISILKDKLPKAAIEHSHIAIELSQEDKLFRIEKKDKQ